MRSIRFLIANLDSYQRMFWLLIVGGALDGAAGFMVPILLSQFLKGEISLKGVQFILPMIAACLLVSLAVQWALRRWGESLNIWILNDLRLKLFRRAERLRPEVLFEHHSGYLLSMIGQVAGSIGGLGSILVWLAGHVATTISLFFFFTARESLIMAVINAFILVVFLLVSLFLSRRIVPLVDRRNQIQAIVNERFHDFLSNILTVRKLGIVEPVLSRLAAESAKSDQANFDFQKFHANRWLLLHSIFYSSVFVTIAFLLYQIELGQAAASIVILFIAGFNRVQNHAERISELIKSLIESDVYVDKLEEILSQQRTFGELPPAFPFKHLEVRDLEHQYGKQGHLIKIPALEVAAGERILISGQSGQGKSTLLSIVARQLHPDRGYCYWNGDDFRSFNAKLGDAFALVAQETELFNLSLRENLSMNETINDQDMIELLKELGLAEFLRGLPDGLDTNVGEKGLKLSAGQKQRVNLARGLLLKRPILLLDEPTSHLDTYSEDIVVRRLSVIPREVTIIIVSHRPALRKICSREYRYERGVLGPIPI